MSGFLAGEDESGPFFALKFECTFICVCLKKVMFRGNSGFLTGEDESGPFFALVCVCAYLYTEI